MVRPSVYFLFHAFLSVAFIVTFTLRFGYSLEVIPIHLSVLVLLNSALFALRLILERAIPQNRFKHLIWITLIACYWFYLALVYTINWYSNKFWGGNVMAGFIADLPRHLDSMSRLYEFPFFAVYSILLFVFGLFWLLAAKLMKSHLAPSQGGLFHIFALSISIVYLSLVANSNHLQGQWGHEPIISSFLSVDATYNNARSAEQRVYDQIVRKNIKPRLKEIEVRRNVILIIADALRADHLPIYGYGRETSPFLSSLGPAIQFVDNFTATCPESVCSIMSTLASREYEDIGFGLYKISDVLKDAGYKTHYLLSSSHEWNNLRELYGEGIDLYLDGNSRFPEYSMYDDRAVVLNLNEIGDYSDQPAFFYFHLISAHQISAIEPPFERFQPSSRALSELASYDPRYIAPERRQALINGYDNGVIQADNYIKEILNILGTKGYLDDAIVAITSDHGEALGERGFYYHTYRTYQEDIGIPFIFLDPSGQCRLENRTYGTLLDVSPTILDCLGFPEVPTYQGISLLEPAPAVRYTLHQSIRSRGELALIRVSRDRIYKLMLQRTRMEISNFRLFEITEDPEELNNIIDSAESELVFEMLDVVFERLGIEDKEDIIESYLQARAR